ncbi:MAG: chemotaxis protein MotA [Blastocatellia bacterium]|jgi:chemotaxis protein MotA|nr:chemotaxis protein MotA [Blastocatellia bacterium]
MKRFEPTVLIGLLIGGVAIVGAMLFEGINPRFLWQPTAALIVLGGTLGAVTVRCGLSGLRSILGGTLRLFRKETTDDDEATIARLAWLARNAKRDGFRIFEQYAATSNDPLIERGLNLAADYIEPNIVRAALDSLLDYEDQVGRRHAAILESAGGYAPTFGILGAVLGLIHVLRSLDNPGALGVGIATAFVATIYGIGFANLLFFPLASRLREQHESRMLRREALADALVAVSAHESPANITRRFSNHPSFKSAGELHLKSAGNMSR